MIDVYFGKEKTKKNLRERLIRDKYYFRKKRSGKPLTIYQQTRAKDYEKAIRGLCQNIYHAQAVSDLTLLNDIYELYFTVTTAFYSKPGPQVPHTIVATLSDQTFPTFYANLDSFVRDMPRQKRGTPVLFREDVLTIDYYWDMDKDLWAALCQSHYLTQWIDRQNTSTEDGWALMEWLFVIKRRLVQLYNDMVTERAEAMNWDPADYLLAMDEEGAVTLQASDACPTLAQAEAVFTAGFGDLVVERSFAANLVRTLLQLLRREEAAEGIAEHMKDLPIMGLLTASSDTMGLSKEDRLLLVHYFPAPKNKKEAKGGLT